MRCSWQGNLRNSQYFLSEQGRGETYEERFYLLEASRRGDVTPTEKSTR